MATLSVRVVSPEKIVYQGEAGALVAPAWDGMVGILGSAAGRDPGSVAAGGVAGACVRSRQEHREADALAARSQRLHEPIQLGDASDARAIGHRIEEIKAEFDADRRPAPARARGLVSTICGLSPLLPQPATAVARVQSGGQGPALRRMTCAAGRFDLRQVHAGAGVRLSKLALPPRPTGDKA